MKGALASRANLLAISVLPTPVGPIMRMFFGVISCRRDSATCWRRQRVRKAIAPARFAAVWPTMCLSSSSTISRGVICDIVLQFLDGQAAIGVDTDIRGNIQRSFDDIARRQFALHEGESGRLREPAAGTDGDQIMLRLDHIARARYDIRAFKVGDAQECLEPAQATVGAPVLGQLDCGARQIAEFLQLALEALE